MKLAFRRHRDGHNHTEVVFSDGAWASSMPGLGVRLAVDGFRFPGEYDFVDVAGDEATVRKWFLDHDGDAYDWSAKLTGIDREGREYCTEAVVLALQTAGLFTDLVAHKTRADDLYERAKGKPTIGPIPEPWLYP